MSQSDAAAEPAPRPPRSILWWVLPLGMLLFWAPLALGVRPGRYSADSGPSAIISIIQLLVISVLAWQTYGVRRRELGAGRRSAACFWALMGFAFAFLAVDEAARIHENAALWIRRGLDLGETAFSSRLDDLIIAAYGVAGLAVLWRYRAELARFRPAWPLLAAGFVLLFAMVAMDLLTNRKDVIPHLVQDASLSRRILLWGAVAEEMFKVLAEGFFIGAFHACRELARSRGVAALPAGSEQPAT
jgi:hypothetical protein